VGVTRIAETLSLYICSNILEVTEVIRLDNHIILSDYYSLMEVYGVNVASSFVIVPHHYTYQN
jgi:hypothetical protein